MQNIIAYSRGPNLISKKRVREERQHAALTIGFPAGEKGLKTLGAQWGVRKGVCSRQPSCASKALKGSHTFATAVYSLQWFSTFLTLGPFNTVPHTVVNPDTHHEMIRCYFTTVILLLL